MADTTGVDTTRAQPTARDLLQLLNTVQRVPRTTAAAAAKKIASQSPQQTAKDIAKVTAKTVSVAVSPGLYLLQQAGLRSGSMVAGALDPALEAAGKEMGSAGRGGFHPAPADALSRSAAGAFRGLTKMEPPVGKPETAVSDVLRKHGVKEGFYRHIPGGADRLTELMFLSGANPKALSGFAKGAEFVTGPEGMALGTEIFSGDRINDVAAATGRVINQSRLPDVLAQASERLVNAPGVRKVTRPIAETFQVMPMIGRNIRHPITGELMVERGREKMLEHLRKMAGERGALESRWAREISGGPAAIEEGARKFNMTVEDRQKYLETIREHLRRQGPAGLDIISQGEKALITPSEAEYLKRVGYLLDTSIPAVRGASGQRTGRLNEASERAADKALTAINRVQRQAEELRLQRRGELPVYEEQVGGGFGRKSKLGEIASYDAEARRRDLIKAIRDAHFAVRGFSRTSRHFILPPDIDLKNLHRYTTDELLGITEQLTTQEMADLGKVPFSKSLLPAPLTEVEQQAGKEERLWRGFVRPKAESGIFQARVFDRYGNEVWRSDVQDVGAGIRQIREKFPEASEEIGSSKAPWMTEKVTRGPYKSPLDRFESIRKEIEDRDKYFVNYLPRLESEELVGKTQALRKKRGGISTSIGGARISSPVTTHEQARRLLRERFVRESREANSGNPATRIQEPLQGLTEALSTHIQSNASATSKSRFLERVRQSFGVEAVDEGTERYLRAEGWRTLGSLQGATTGMRREVSERFQRSYVPESVFNGLKALDEALAPVNRQGFSKFWHNLLQTEKTYLTVVNPRFNIRNRAWEVMASYSRGNKNVRNWTDADKLLMGDYDNVKVPGFDMTGKELRSALEREGVLGPDLGIASEVRLGRSAKMQNRTRDIFQKTEQVRPTGFVVTHNGRNYRYNTRELTEAVRQFERRFPNARDYSITSTQDKTLRTTLREGMGLKEMAQAAGRDVSDIAMKPVRAMSSSNLTGEARARVAHWFWGVRDKKMHWDKARQEVAFTIFDYGRDFLTAREAKLREWIPFYTWFRRIVPFAIQNTIERPGELAKIGMVQAHINALNGVAPEEMEYLGRTYLNSVGVVLPDQADQRPGTKRVLNVPYGVNDPSQFMNLSEDLGDVTPLGEWTGAVRGVAQTLRPSVQLPLSFLYAMSTSGEKYTGEIVKLPAAAMLLPDPVKEQLGIQVRGDGLPWGPSTLIPVIRYLQGGVGEAGGGLLSKNPRLRAKARAWLMGVSIDPEVPLAQNKVSAGWLQWQHMLNKWGIQTRGVKRIMRSESQFAPPEATETEQR